MKALRMGVVGLGYIGERHARILHDLPNVELVAVADLDAERGRALASRLGAAFHGDAAELFARDDVDAVTLCVPDRAHEAPAVAAARAGKHVLLEKPMAHTAAAAERIARAVEEAGVRLMVAHVLRFDPRYAQLRAAADPARMGEPVHLRAKRNGVRRTSARVGPDSSILFYLGVHDVDMMQWVARSRIARVYARRVQKVNRANEDAVYAVLDFENGAIGLLDYSWAWPDGLPGGYWAAFEVVGTRSAALMDVRDQGFHVITEDGPRAADTHLWPEVHGHIVGDLRDEVVHFVGAVLSGAPFVQPYREALDAVRVLDALAASIGSGRPEPVARP